MGFEFILLAGQMEHGKDEVATALLHALGPDWTRAKFATCVYRAVAEILDTTVEELNAWKRRDEPFPGTAASVRSWLQFVGDGARGLDPDIWINREMPAGGRIRRRVYTDGRYPNEVRRSWDRGGLGVLVYRPGFINDIEHPSEAHLRPLLRFAEEARLAGPVTPGLLAQSASALAPGVAALLSRFHHVLCNDGTVDDLRRKARGEILPRLTEG